MNPQPNSGPSIPAVNTFTRRSFMKTTALTVGAVALLSQGKALGDGQGRSSSQPPATDPPTPEISYTLKCQKDPFTGKTNEPELRAQQGSSLNDFWAEDRTTLDLPWYVGGPGSGGSWMTMTMSAEGPKQGQIGNRMEVKLNAEGHVAIDGKILLRITTKTKQIIASQRESLTEAIYQVPDHMILFLEPISVGVFCDGRTGEITFDPNSGCDSDDQEALTVLGKTVVKIFNFAAFKTRGEVTHDFRSVFDQAGELSAGFKGILNITGAIKYDVSKLKDVKGTVPNLRWLIYKIKTTKIGNTIDQEALSLGPTPMDEDDKKQAGIS